MLALKPFQERALESLREYLKRARRLGARTAFFDITNRPYRVVPELPELPYVCLRLPTGGGKTLVAAHSIGLVAREFLGTDRPTVLWLVPSNVIRDQTLKALRNRAHSYRQAIEAAFPAAVQVLDLAEALSVQRSVLDGETTIVVSTLAALRVQDTEGRKIYSENGALDHHFSGLSEEQRRLLEVANGERPTPSLANALRLRRPLIVMDEAHNARTSLSFATLARFLPSVVLELSATPELEHDPQRGWFASNVLHHASALELKQAEMIKLPIELVTRPAWQDVVDDAIAKQRELEAIAARAPSGERPIRPIVLVQAQPRSAEHQTLTVDFLRDALFQQFQIPPEQIAISAYDTDELADRDLEADSCPVRFILTVQKLREGWDCPWAYILCSVAEQTSATAVEQILGRVLRLPEARRRHDPALNRAYAFVASSSFVDTARALTDALVDNGFERIDAEALVRAATSRPQTELGLFATYSEPVPEPPDLSGIELDLRSRLRFEPSNSILTVEGALTPAEESQLEATVTRPEARAAIRRLGAISRGESPSLYEPIRVPRLAVEVDGQIELFGDQHFLDATWTLASEHAGLSEAEFSTSLTSARAGEIDVHEGRARLEIVPYSEELERQISMFRDEGGWTVPKLAAWLDRQVPHPDLSQVEVTTYFQRVVESLISERALEIGVLARHRFRLRAALEGRLSALRRAAESDLLQRSLFGLDSEVRTSSAVELVFEPERYAPSTRFEGAFRFRKHAFPGLVGELGDEGEEFRCALRIDGLADTDCWIRNLAGPGRDREENSFWLQTPWGKFYPDFVIRLKDERILVVEYKGAHIAEGAREQDKRRVGELWAERSDGSCLFAFPTSVEDLSEYLASNGLH